MDTGKYLLLHPLNCGVSALQLQGAALEFGHVLMVWLRAV